MSEKRKPSYIDGHERICCGSRAHGTQCDDCPMKAIIAENAKYEFPGVHWSDESQGWVRDGKKWSSWEDATYGPVGAARRRYEIARSSRKAHPETIVRLWEEYTELWHREQREKDGSA